MEPHARKCEIGYDPVVDTVEYRRRLRQHLLASAAELDAEHGPVDPELEAEIRAKLLAADSER